MFTPDGIMVGLCVWQLAKWAVRNIIGTTLEPIPLPKDPKYSPSRDISLVVPTIGFDADFIISLRSWLSNNPKEIIIVTIKPFLNNLVDVIERELSAEERKTIQTISYHQANKRQQLVAGIQQATGDIIFFVWRTRIVFEALFGDTEVNNNQQTSLRTLLVLATHLPALIGHVRFALDQPWFWKHMPIQFAMGAMSTFFSAYTLATLHETSWGSRKV